MKGVIEVPRLIDEKSITDPPFKNEIGPLGHSLYLFRYVEVPHTFLGKFDLKEVLENYGEEALSTLEEKGIILTDRLEGLYFIPSYFTTNLKNLAQNGIDEKFLTSLETHRSSHLAGHLYRELRKRVSEKKYKEVHEALDAFASRNSALVKKWNLVGAAEVSDSQKASSAAHSKSTLEPPELESGTGKRIRLFDGLPNTVTTQLEVENAKPLKKGRDL